MGDSSIVSADSSTAVAIKQTSFDLVRSYSFTTVALSRG